MSRTTRAFLFTSLVALVVAALLHLLLLLGMSGVWSGLIHLTLFGWITGMIVTVNYHTMPVFSARDFPFPRLLAAHWAVFSLGIVFATCGLLGGWQTMIGGGLLLQLIGAWLFVANTVLLFLRGKPRAIRPPVPPIPDQARVDRIGTQATKSAGMCLPLALILVLAEHRDWISSGWLLAAEHLLALGWIMLMIVGVAYHVLPRFSGRGVRGAVWARVQFECQRVALVLIVLALGVGWAPVFAGGALLMAAALGMFAWTIWPTLVGIRRQPEPIQITLNERLP